MNQARRKRLTNDVQCKLYETQRILRKEVCLSFNKANLYPFPKGRIWLMQHLKQQSAWYLLSRSIVEEMYHKYYSPPPPLTFYSRALTALIQRVIWRHTGGGYCHWAQHFIIQDPEGGLLIRVKLNRRWQILPVSDYSLSCLPDAAFPSAADTLHKWKSTGAISWFPESKDANVRDMSIFEKYLPKLSDTVKI